MQLSLVTVEQPFQCWQHQPRSEEAEKARSRQGEDQVVMDEQTGLHNANVYVCTGTKFWISIETNWHQLCWTNKDCADSGMLRAVRSLGVSQREKQCFFSFEMVKFSKIAILRKKVPFVSATKSGFFQFSIGIVQKTKDNLCKIFACGGQKKACLNFQIWIQINLIWLKSRPKGANFF